MLDCFQLSDYPICTYVLPPPCPICLIASNLSITLFARICYHPLPYMFDCFQPPDYPICTYMLSPPLPYIFYSFQSSDYPICTICYHPFTLYVWLLPTVRLPYLHICYHRPTLYVLLLPTVRLPYLHIYATTLLPYTLDCLQPSHYPIWAYMLPPPYPICLIASNRPITLFAQMCYHPLTIYVTLLSTLELPYLHIYAITPLPYMLDRYQQSDYPICTYMLPPFYPIC